jgi:hypothetical protein
MSQIGKFLETGLMFANAAYHVLVSLLRLQHMAIVMVRWHIILEKDITVKHHLTALNMLAPMYFEGNIWAGNTKATIAFFLDERANQKQRVALQMIFSGKAGGFMGELSGIIGDVRGLDFAPIKFDIADDLSYWSAEIPGKVLAKAEALTGPMTPPGKRVDY